MSDYFWTDPEQANDRLYETYVLYDRQPIYIKRVHTIPNINGEFVIEAKFAKSRHKCHNLSLTDPLWNRFQDLPPLGWVNSEKHCGALLAERIPVRNKQHGLSNSNTRFGTFNKRENCVLFSNRPIALDDFFSDIGYSEALCGQWPNLSLVLSVIAPESIIAFSFKYAVYRNEQGLRWLFRRKHPVGIFVSTEQFLLLNQYFYLKEELQEAEEFTIDKILEY